MKKGKVTLKKTWLQFMAVILLLSFSACDHKYKLRMLVPDESKEVMGKIANEINGHSKFQIDVFVEDSLTEVKAIDKVLNNEYDMTIVDNTIDYHKSKKYLKTVIPFFHEVLVILSRHNLKQSQIDSLLKSGDFLILSKEVEELDFYKKIIPDYTGDTTFNYRLEDHYNIEKDLEINELLLFFTHKDNKELGDLLYNKKAFIYSLDAIDTKGSGSFIEGFCREYKKTTPFVLSRHAFGVVLEKPVYTLAVHELLVSTTELSTEVVFDLIETIHHHHIVKLFESSNSYTFEVNQQDINLSFPFHTGTIDYLNREKPSFIERYSEFMGFVLSAFVLLIGLSASLRSTINRRKKDRMDEYYKELLELKEQFETLEVNVLDKQLRNLQKKVFQLLIDEKLSANNEFLIFMMLWDELYHSIEKKRYET
jgi:hypothetical protein